MTFTHSVWTGEGWIGRVTTDIEGEVILHETTRALPTEEEAGYCAWCEWVDILSGPPLPEGERHQEAGQGYTAIDEARAECRMQGLTTGEAA